MVEEVPEDKLENDQDTAEHNDATQIMRYVAKITLSGRGGSSGGRSGSDFSTRRDDRRGGGSVLKLVLAIRLRRFLLCH